MTIYQISILKEETDAWLIDNCLEYIELSLIFSTFLRALELYYPANDPNFSKKIFFGCYCIIIIVRGGPIFVGFVGSDGSIYKHLFNTYSFTSPRTRKILASHEQWPQRITWFHSSYSFVKKSKYPNMHQHILS